MLRGAGNLASRAVRGVTRPLALMGIGALGAAALSHSRDDQLPYTPLPGSFVQ